MITSGVAFDGIRAQLRERVLPELDDEATRSVVFAILGMLRDLELQVREDDDWCGVSARELAEGARRWRGWLADDADVAGELHARLDAATRAETPRKARAELLAAAELVVDRLWQPGAAGSYGAELADVRALLAADLARQLERIT
jgi:hypothetical protein